MLFEQLYIFPQKEKENNFDPYLVSYKKLKYIGEQNVRAKTLKFLEENIGVSHHDHEPGNNFLDMAPKANHSINKLPETNRSE